MANIFEKFKNIAPTLSPAEVEVEEVDENATEREEAESEVETDVEVAEVEEIEDEPAGVKGGKPSAPSNTPAPTRPKELNWTEQQIKAYFEEEAKRDAEFAAKYAATKWSVQDVYQFLAITAMEPGVAGGPDHENARAKAFIMDDNAKLPALPSGCHLYPRSQSKPKAEKKPADKKAADKTKSNSKTKKTNVRIPSNTGSVSIETVTKNGATKTVGAVIVPSKPQQKSIFDYAVEEGISLFD